MKPVTVTVPVVATNQTRGHGVATAVCTLWCGPAGSGELAEDVPRNVEPPPPPADIRLAPVAAELLTSYLFDSGYTAAKAVYALNLDAHPLALWQRMRPHAWLAGRRLRASGATPDEGHSAELGLALALLLPVARYRGMVMATGSLSDPQAQGAGPVTREAPVQAPRPRELSATDTPVYPVAHLGPKLAELAIRVRKLAGDRAGHPKALCFTPLTDEHGSAAEDLPEARALVDLGVEVVPVAGLEQAARRLGCRYWPWLTGDLVALALTAGLLGMLTIGAALYAWRHWPLPLAFERGGGIAAAAEPYVACITPDGRYAIPTPLPRDNAIPVIGPGEKLAWDVRVGDADAVDARLMKTLGHTGYHVLFAVVFADGQTEIRDYTAPTSDQPLSLANRVPPGRVWDQWYQIPTQSADGEAGLVVLARRDRPFDIPALRRTLDAHQGAPAAERVGRVVSDLRSRAPGFIFFQFDRRSHVKSPCPSL